MLVTTPGRAEFAEHLIWPVLHIANDIMRFPSICFLKALLDFGVILIKDERPVIGRWHCLSP